MEFPEITVKQVFRRIPDDEIEKVSECAWNKAFHSLGNCEIMSQKKLGSGRFDALVRYYDSKWERYAWILIEYKRAKRFYSRDLWKESLCQLFMYLGNFFYDVSLEGTDDFAGIVTASCDHFYFIPRENIVKLMEKFEPIWKEHFRVTPNEAYKVNDIKWFIESHLGEIFENAVKIERYGDGDARLDEIIKSIYEEWNLR